MTPDPVFVADLAAYDADLRVRWSTHRAKFGKPVWIIERKVPANAPREMALLKALDLGKKRPRKLNQARTLDLWEGMRDGYAHVLDVHRDLLSWSQVGPILAKADAWRRGGMDAIARDLEAQDDADEQARERHAQNVIEDRLQGVYDAIQWDEKRRVNVPVEVSAATEHHDGFTVRDLRAVAVA